MAGSGVPHDRKGKPESDPGGSSADRGAASDALTSNEKTREDKGVENWYEEFRDKQVER